MMENKSPWYARIKRPFWRALIAPIFIGPQYHKVDTFIWMMFIVVASQLGTIINVIRRFVFEGWAFQAALGPDTSNGVFYTFALVMMASLIGPLFMRFIHKDPPEYRTVSMVFITILFFFILFCAVFYAFAAKGASVDDFAKLENSDMALDVPQFIFFIVAILFSLYSFGLTKIKEHEDILRLSDDHLAEDNAQRRKLSESVDSRDNNSISINGKDVRI